MVFFSISKDSYKIVFGVQNKNKDSQTLLIFNFRIVVIINYPLFKFLSLLEMVQQTFQIFIATIFFPEQQKTVWIVQ